MSNRQKKSFMELSATQNNSVTMYLLGHSYFDEMDIGLNNMVEEGELFVESSDPKVTGLFLQDQWNKRNINLIPALESKQYDYFFFGEWIANSSELSSKQVATTIQYATLLKELLDTYGKEMYLMVPWSFATGFKGHEGYACGEAGQEILNSLYNSVAEVVGLHLVPVGDAFIQVKKLQPNAVLHIADGSHPTDHGKYLRNAVVYTYFLNKNPMNLNTLGLKTEDADLFNTVAWDVIQKPIMVQ